MAHAIMFFVFGAPIAIYVVYCWIDCWRMSFRSWWRQRRNRRILFPPVPNPILPHHRLMAEGKNWL